MSVGNRELKIVASSPGSEVIASEGKPVLMPWRWRYSKPTLLLWVALLVLLVVPKENRNWQAWLILVVPALALLLRLFYLIPSVGSSSGFDLLIQFIVTFAIGWACVWLAAPFISGESRRRSLLLAGAVMMGVGLLAYLGYFGFWSGTTGTMTIFMWCLTCVALLLSLGVSGKCCGGHVHPGMLALWLLLWLPVVTAACVVTMYTSTMLIQGVSDLTILFIMIVPMLFMSAFGSAFLYIVTAPILLLAGLTDCYGERFRRMLSRAPREEPSNADILPEGGNPFGSEAIGEGEVSSRSE